MSEHYEVWREPPDGRGGTFAGGWRWRFVADSGEVIAESPRGTLYATRAMLLRRMMRLMDHAQQVHFMERGTVRYQVMSHLITPGGRVRTCEEARKDFTNGIMGGL